jgi:hypothetical protein
MEKCRKFGKVPAFRPLINRWDIIVAVLESYYIPVTDINFKQIYISDVNFSHNRSFKAFEANYKRCVSK